MNSDVGCGTDAAIGRIQADTQGQLTMMQGLDNTLSIQMAQRPAGGAGHKQLKSLV